MVDNVQGGKNTVSFNTTKMNASRVSTTDQNGNLQWSDLLTGNEEDVNEATQLFDLNNDGTAGEDELLQVFDFNKDGVIDSQDYNNYQQEEENPSSAGASGSLLPKGIKQQTFSDVSSFLHRLKQKGS